MRTLDGDQIRAFLLEGTRTAKVAVVRTDGSPLVTPVWFLVEADGTIVFTTGKSTVKGRALEANHGCRSASRTTCRRLHSYGSTGSPSSLRIL